MTLSSEKKRRLILVTVFGLMVLVASYYFGFRWINEAREMTDIKEHKLSEKMEKVKKVIDDGKIAQTKIEQIEKQLKSVREKMPPEQAETWLARAMDTTANRHQLKMKGSRLSDPDPFAIEEVKAFKHFGLVGYAFNIQGTYFQLGEYLADLEGSHPLMVVESMTIIAGGGGATHIHEMSVKIDMITIKD